MWLWPVVRTLPMGSVHSGFMGLELHKTILLGAGLLKEWMLKGTMDHKNSNPVHRDFWKIQTEQERRVPMQWYQLDQKCTLPYIYEMNYCKHVWNQYPPRHSCNAKATKFYCAYTSNEVFYKVPKSGWKEATAHLIESDYGAITQAIPALGFSQPL